VNSQPATENKADEDSKKAFKLDDLGAAGTLLAAVGGGLGVLGFVTFFGGAILWVRMDEAGLPGSEAVAVIPKSMLLSTGANFLFPAFLAALGFTLLLYLVETAVNHWRSGNLRRLERELKAARGQAEARHKAQQLATHKAERAVEEAQRVELLATEAAKIERLDEQVVRNIQEAAEQAARSAAEVRLKAPEGSDADAELVRLRREVDEARALHSARIERHRRKLRLALISLLFAVGALVTMAVFSVGFQPGRIFVLGVLTAGLVAVCLAVLTETDSFPWFALTAFVAVGILSGFLTYYRTVNDPKVEPAAVLRTDGPPMYGFFVAQTSDRIYLGSELPRGEVRLEAIPREKVTALAISALAPQAVAGNRARRLALQICRLSRQRPVAATQGAAGAEEDPPQEACTKAEFERLRS
jgi:VIT1/CCC1 family predicted Fe2+/Mn2+ transporter